MKQAILSPLLVTSTSQNTLNIETDKLQDRTLAHQLSGSLMHTPFGTLPQHLQQEVLWHLQANDFPGAKRVRDTYERQQRLKGFHH